MVIADDRYPGTLRQLKQILVQPNQIEREIVIRKIFSEKILADLVILYDRRQIIRQYLPQWDDIALNGDLKYHLLTSGIRPYRLLPGVYDYNQIYNSWGLIMGQSRDEWYQDLALN